MLLIEHDFSQHHKTQQVLGKFIEQWSEKWNITKFLWEFEVIQERYFKFKSGVLKIYTVSTKITQKYKLVGWQNFLLIWKYWQEKIVRQKKIQGLTEKICVGQTSRQ